MNRARGRGDARLLAEALRRRGLVARTQGRLESAEHDLREAAALLAEGGSPSLRTQTLHGLALALRSRGRIPEALALLEEARELAAAHGLDNDLCSLRLAMGGIAIQTGDTASASRELSAVLALSERTARRVDRAMALNGLAELQRKAGELAEAARLYREALALFEATGMTQAVFPRLNLGLIHLARGEWDQATDALRAALADLERQGRVGLAGATHGMLLAPSIARGELADAAHHLQEARARLDRTGFAEPDLIWSLELAVSQARELGATTLAVSVEHLLERQRAQLRGT